MQDNATHSMNQVDTRDWLAGFGIDSPSLDVSALTLDSREVAVHTVFFAVKGHQLDGRDFIPQAISLGARLILAETDESAEHGQIDMREHTVIIYVHALPEKLSDMASAFYANPTSKLDVIAVTGTNGKTSTVQLCSQLRDLTGERAAAIGTLGAGFVSQQEGLEQEQTVNTTPDALNMQRLIADFVAKGAKQVSLEASSHALVQHRLSAVNTHVAVFTNLTRDHLDYHGTMSEYARAKRLLLNQPSLKWAVLNADDAEHQAWLKVMPESVTPVLFGIESQDVAKNADHFVIAKGVTYSTSGCHFSLQSSWGNAQISTALIGQFNVSNVLAAIAAQLCLGKALDEVVNACQDLKPVPGRMELYYKQGSAGVAVDYAHTPDALIQSLKALRAHTDGQLWCVFGCGGDRDQGKRPLMGEVAEQYADRIVITNDNSRMESPQEIAEQILAGMRAPEEVFIELDRKQAIQYCLAQASDTDAILVAGKGHEDYQIINGQTLPYNERHFVASLLQGRGQ